jgi:hypothetical protein
VHDRIQQEIAEQDPQAPSYHEHEDHDERYPPLGSRRCDGPRLTSCQFALVNRGYFCSLHFSFELPLDPISSCR